MCRFLSVSRSGYYDCVKRIDIPVRYSALVNAINECQQECNKTYGNRRVWLWLIRNAIHYNPKTILRVMQKYNLLSVVRRRKYRNYSKHLHRYDICLMKLQS